ncbi:hypothetical protein F2P81_019214 [Scophthalmus maximus]|uniref:Uncharacterized protein n=1 Tax=Scophthalmus maximus TaxID=52904 RepID=A0A6A4S4Y4_SCOMX|nr:hypothetical protein F2P81_019214 [Scophthalmus maximus]
MCVDFLPAAGVEQGRPSVLAAFGPSALLIRMKVLEVSAPSDFQLQMRTPQRRPLLHVPDAAKALGQRKQTKNPKLLTKSHKINIGN